MPFKVGERIGIERFGFFEEAFPSDDQVIDVLGFGVARVGIEVFHAPDFLRRANPKDIEEGIFFGVIGLIEEFGIVAKVEDLDELFLLSAVGVFEMLSVKTFNGRESSREKILKVREVEESAEEREVEKRFHEGACAKAGDLEGHPLARCVEMGEDFNAGDEGS